MILVTVQTPTAQNENRAPLRPLWTGWPRRPPLGVSRRRSGALDWKEHSVTDPQWKTSAARLALRTRCAVSRRFSKAPTAFPSSLRPLAPRTATMALAGSSANAGQDLHVRIGSPSVTPCWRVPKCEQATAYIDRDILFIESIRARARTLLPFASRGPTIAPRGRAAPFWGSSCPPGECELAGEKLFRVPRARFANPRVLAKSPFRELAFRKVGKAREHATSTGSTSTTSISSSGQDGSPSRRRYRWRRPATCYRDSGFQACIPAPCSFPSAFLRAHRSAVELGRSFVVRSIRRTTPRCCSSGKGSATVARRPEAPILFGAVSISPEYRRVAQPDDAYLSDRAAHELARLWPRRKFPDRTPRNQQISDCRRAADIEDLSLSIGIEDDGKGVPVLILNT